MPLTIGVIIMLIFLFRYLYKRRHYKDVFYAISTQRAYIHCPLIYEASRKIGDSMERIVTIDDGDTSLFFYKSAIKRNESVVSMDLSKIKEISITPGQRGYDFYFTYEVNKKIMKFRFAALVRGYTELLETLSNMQFNFQIIES